MEQLLWHLLAATRGGSNRLRIVVEVAGGPLNAHQLAGRLGLDYRTVRHHVDVLLENGVLARPQGEAYGSRLVLSGATRGHFGSVEEISKSARRPSPAARPRVRPLTDPAGGG